MPVNKEFAITMEDRPGTFGKFGRVLAENKVNIIAFQAYPFERKSEVRLIVDNHTALKKILDAQGIPYTEVEVAHVRLQHRPGELARVASKLGEANINIDYAYPGIDPNTNAPILFFGVKDVARAAKILDEVVAKAA